MADPAPPAAQAAPGAAKADTAAPDPVKVDLATQVLDATHARDTMLQVIDTMMPQMMKVLNQGEQKIPQDVLARFETLARQDMVASMPQLLKAQAEIYARHYSEADLRSLLDFYESPTGQHMIAETPKIMKEAMPLGMEWGRAAGTDAMQKAIAELRKEGAKI